jgi:hypothetical protein
MYSPASLTSFSETVPDNFITLFYECRYLSFYPICVAVRIRNALRTHVLVCKSFGTGLYTVESVYGVDKVYLFYGPQYVIPRVGNLTEETSRSSNFEFLTGV